MSIYSATVMLDKPSAYWRCGEASGNLSDISGNKLTAFLNSTAPTYGQAGLLTNDSNTSILFGGLGYFAPTYIGSLLNAPIFTLEVIFRPLGTGADSSIISNLVGTTSGYSMRWNPATSTIQAVVQNASGTVLGPSSSLSLTAHHIVITYDGTNLTLWVDGALIGSQIASYVISNIATQIARNSSSTTLLSGTIEELAVYTSVLSSARITAHFNAMQGFTTVQLARQIEVYRLHRDVCISNGHAQKTFLHRANEGTLVPVPGFPNNMEYQAPDPRMSDNPNTGGTQLWATWQPLRIRAGNQDAGDTPAARMWVSKSEVQFPAIDDNFVQIIIQDDDFISDDQGARYNIENPMLDPSGSFWTAVLDRVR